MGLNITVASKFNPFTYDDYIKPYKENIETYFKHYRDTENKLSDLGTQLEALDYIIESEPEDSPLKSTYGNYKKELEKAAEALTTGWSQADVQNYNKLKKMFAKDISPIATQYARRQKLEDEQRKVKESKPSIYFNKRAAETSLAEMIDNPNWSYTSFVGDDITKAVQSMVSPVATILDNIWKDGQVGDYDKILSKYGISPEDVSAYFNGNLTGGLAKFFDDARNTVIKSYGVDTWNDQNALNTAYQYANIGIPKAIGKLTPQLVAPRKPTGNEGDGGGENRSETPSKPSVSIHSMGTIQDKDRLTNTLEAEKQWKSIAGTDGTNGTGVTIKANEYRAALAKDGITDFSAEHLEYLANGGNNKSEMMELSDGSIVYTKRDRKGERVQKLARQLLDEYNTINQIRSSVVYTAPNADGTSEEIGLYGSTVKNSMDTKLAYNKARSAVDYTVYEPSFEPNTRKDILTRWVREASYEEVPMYKINNAGQREEMKDKDRNSLLSNIMSSNGNIKDTVGIFLSPQNGIEIEYNGSRYAIDNYSSRDLRTYSDLMRNTYNELYDFEEQTLRDYLDKQGSYNTLGADDFTKDGKLSKAGLEFLNQGELWEAKEGSNYKHAFVYVGDELVKIIADISTGGILGIIPISSITGNYQNSGPGLIMKNLASQIARGWHPRTTNKDLTTPPRGK